MKRLLLLGLCIVMLAGCSNTERYTPILAKNTVLITTNVKDGSVSFIDSHTKHLLTTWNIHKAIMGSVLFPDGDTFAVYGPRLARIYLYSLKSGKQIGQWEVGQGVSNALISPNQKYVALANQQTNIVTMYTINGTKKADIPVGNSPLTFVQNKHELYVINFHDDKLSVIDWRKKQKTRDISIPFSSMGAVMYHDELWMGGHGNGEQVNASVHIYNSKQGQLIRSISAPEMPVSFSADASYIYVLSHGSDMLRKIDAKTYTEKAELEVGSNPFAVVLEGDNLYVASYDSDEVYVVDAQTMKIVQIISVGKGPFQFTVRNEENA